MVRETVPAWECNDKEQQAKVAYNAPLRRANKSLADENMRLKRLLRENGIAWSPLAQNHIKETQHKKRATRSSMAAQGPGLPQLPTEVVLRIMKFALSSAFPIIDPLSHSNPATLTDAEKSRGNQIASNFILTCKAFKAEGERCFWSYNTFTFTSIEAVRVFGDLPLEYRKQVTHVTFRIIAQYYDDQQRKHKLDRVYHHDLKKDHTLKVHPRAKEGPLIRGGFRSYSWNHITDFLTTLRAPYDPQARSKNPKPRLLPNLASLRLDLVNFSDPLLPFSGVEFHEVTCHEFGCTLNELQVTGMPEDESGIKASAELSGLLKDEGLFLDGAAAYLYPSKGSLQPLPGNKWLRRVVRAMKENDEDLSEIDGTEDIFTHRNHIKVGVMPPAPEEPDQPETNPSWHNLIIWKRVPISRDSQERSWVRFARRGGQEIREGSDDEDEFFCPCCGDIHSTGTDWVDEDEDDLE